MPDTITITDDRTGKTVTVPITGGVFPASAVRELDRLTITTIGREETREVGARGRPVTVYQAPIRLIATRWIYDGATKTLFTSDMWTHTWRERPDGPWIIEDGDDDLG